MYILLVTYKHKHWYTLVCFTNTYTNEYKNIINAYVNHIIVYMYMHTDIFDNANHNRRYRTVYFL